MCEIKLAFTIAMLFRNVEKRRPPTSMLVVKDFLPLARRERRTLRLLAGRFRGHFPVQFPEYRQSYIFRRRRRRREEVSNIINRNRDSSTSLSVIEMELNTARGALLNLKLSRRA